MTVAKSLRSIAFQEANIAIIERIKTGDADALQDLWNANKRLVAHVALSYLNTLAQRNSIDFDDLLQVGYIGLHNAANKYDPGKGASYATYAIYHIKNELRRALGINASSKRDAADTARSLDEPLYSDSKGNVTLGDTVAAVEQPDWLGEEGRQRAIRAAVGRMRDESARSAIVAYYWVGKTAGKTLGQVAGDCGILANTFGAQLHKGRTLLRKDRTLRAWIAGNDCRLLASSAPAC